MAAPADGKPILTLDVDTQAWDSFADSFNRYQELLANQPAAWAATNRGVKQLGTAFDHVESEFEKLVKASLDPKFSSQSNGVWTRMSKETAKTEKSWRNISKEIERAGKGMGGLVRNGASLNAVFGLFGSAGLLAGGIYGGTLAAAGSVADQFKSSRELGLPTGEEAEFNTAFKPYGLNRDDLEAAANAKQDVTQRLAFMNAGITNFNQDAAELAWQKARGEAQLFSQWEKTSPEFAQNQAQAFFPGENPDKLRLLADAFDKGDLDRAHEQYEQNLPDVSYNEQQGQAATAFAQDQAQKWKEVEVSWNKDVLLLAPHLDKWSDAAVSLTTKFLDTSANAIKGLADAADHPYPPGTTPPPVTGKTWSERAGSYLANREVVFGQWLQAQGLNDPFNGDGGSSGGTTSGKPATMDALLDAIRQNESSGRPDAVNAASGAAGLYGLMPDTAKAMGVDPMDAQASRGAAQKVLNGFLDKYHGDLGMALAGYDGDTHISADEKKYAGAWWQGAKPETIDYLARIEKQGIDLHMSTEEQAWLDAHTTVKNPKIPGSNMSADNIDGFPITAYDGQNTDDNIDGFPVIPIADQPQSTPASTTTQGLDAVASNLKKLFHDTFGEGAGSALRTNDRTQQLRDRQGNPQQFGVTLNVNAPPGMDVQVSGAQLAQ